ncbi:NAD(P)-dependent oxidoreductase [Bradyrhizobium sp. LLZ17]|uniref:NAD(P)-dependent oxidoreductase n=1 Tax=Bradyrhizobium sp. LLZ17 TaxID=3239388 RepID=A0AB39XB48_9BRAD
MNNPTDESASTTRSKILVLGATGGTGRLIVSEALARRHEVTALVRSPEKAGDLKGARLIVGDISDENALRNALRGQDTVVSALGTPASPFREVKLLSTATRALVTAMKAEQVSRLVCITGMGAGDSAGRGGFLFDRLIFPLLLKNVYADKDRQEAVVRDSGLDWVLVRPSVLNDKPGRGAIRAITDLSDFHGGSIARQDVATFVLDQIQGNNWLHRSPLITW